MDRKAKFLALGGLLLLVAAVTCVRFGNYVRGAGSFTTARFLELHSGHESAPRGSAESVAAAMRSLLEADELCETAERLLREDLKSRGVDSEAVEIRITADSTAFLPASLVGDSFSRTGWALTLPWGRSRGRIEATVGAALDPFGPQGLEGLSLRMRGEFRFGGPVHALAPVMQGFKDRLFEHLSARIREDCGVEARPVGSQRPTP